MLQLRGHDVIMDAELVQQLGQVVQVHCESTLKHQPLFWTPTHHCSLCAPNLLCSQQDEEVLVFRASRPDCKRAPKQNAKMCLEDVGELLTRAKQCKLQRKLSSHGLVSGPQVDAWRSQAQLHTIVGACLHTSAYIKSPE